MSSTRKLLVCVLIAALFTIRYSSTTQANMNTDSNPEFSHASRYDNQCEAVLFSDDFNDGNADGWTTLGDGTWYVDNFEYVVDMGNGSQLKGHSVEGDAAWTDYTFEADVVIQAGWGKDFLFRYIDEDNYYSISLIETVDFLSFVKVKDGIAEIDMLSEYPQDEFEWHHVKIQVIGGQISVHVNGDEAFTYDDSGSEITHGKIGFQGYTGEEVGVLSSRFDNVVVRGVCPEYYIYLPLTIK